MSEKFTNKEVRSQLRPTIQELRDSFLFKVENIPFLEKEFLKLELNSEGIIKDIIQLLDRLNVLDAHDFKALEFIESKFLSEARKLILISSDIDDVVNHLVIGNEQQESRVAGYATSLHLLLDKFRDTLGFLVTSSLIQSVAPDLSKLASYKLDIEKDSKNINDLSRKAAKMVEDISLMPTKEHISNYSKMFGDDSQEFKVASRWWLLGVFIVLAVIVCCAVMVFDNSILTMKDPKTKQEVLIPINHLLIRNLNRLLILSGLFYALAICNKNYKSSKHNQIVNRHRENALASFQAFVESPSVDPATKNAVLLEATKTIYSAQQTGYVVTDNDESPNKLIELVQSFQPK